MLVWAVLAVLGLWGCSGTHSYTPTYPADLLDKMDLTPVAFTQLVNTGFPPEQLPVDIYAREPRFYAQSTILAAPRTTAFRVLTSRTPLETIHWIVTETHLVAVRWAEFDLFGYQYPPGPDPLQDTANIIGLFRIESHEPVRREIDPATGTFRMVYDETAATRPWYQRRFMRVDLTQNLVTRYPLALGLAVDRAEVDSEPLGQYPRSPSPPAFHYSNRGSDQRLDGFDFVVRAVLHPERSHLWLTNGPSANLCDISSDGCEPMEVALRTAFRRVDTQHDYEPAMLARYDVLGAVHTIDSERFGYFDQDRVSGWVDHGRPIGGVSHPPHFASRHNLWQWHHALFTASESPPPGARPCNDDSECESGTVCHLGNALPDGAHRGSCHAPIVHHSQLSGLGTPDFYCGTDDDCRGVGGMSRTAFCDLVTHTCGEHFLRCANDVTCRQLVDSRSLCDLSVAFMRPDDFGLCTLPFRLRVVRPIAFHETERYPERLERVTQQSVAEWNDALAQAIQRARLRECQLDRGEPGAPAGPHDSCDNDFVRGTDPAFGAPTHGGLPDGRYPIVGCHSPVIGTDADAIRAGFQSVNDMHAHGWDLPACGPPGEIARIGDLRHHEIVAEAVDAEQGFWATGTVASDPETGEMIASSGAVSLSVSDWVSARVVSLARILNHDEATDEERTAAPGVLESVRQLDSGETPADETLRLAGANLDLSPFRLPDAGWFGYHGTTLLGTGDGAATAFEISSSRLRNAAVLGDGSDRGSARIALMADSPIERRLVDDRQGWLAGSLRNPDPANPETIRHASPLQGQSISQREIRSQIDRAAAAWQCNIDPSFSVDMLLDLARRLAQTQTISPGDPRYEGQTFGREWTFRRPDGSIDYDTLGQYVSAFLHHGVLTHALGHTLGQRHNFAASADALNYADTYWSVRGQGHGLGLRPRWEYVFDPGDGHYYSAVEADARIEDWATSSVMDLRGVNPAPHGLGRYDQAFVANAYTGLVQAFRQVANEDLVRQFGIVTSGRGVPMPFDASQWQTGAFRSLHYSQIPDVYGRTIDGMPNVRDGNRYWVFADETTHRAVSGWGDPPVANVTVDEHALVPYRFDSEEQEGLVWTDQAYDSGADAYESIHSVAERYLDGYSLGSFGPWNHGIDPAEYSRHTWEHYVRPLHGIPQRLARELIVLQDLIDFDRPVSSTEPRNPIALDARLAIGLSANTLVAMLSMPEYGLHGPRQQADGQTIIAATPYGPPNFPIPPNEGRAFDSQTRFASGFQPEFLRIGSFYDKTLALQALTSPNLVVSESGWDTRSYQLSVYTLFPAQTIRYFGGLLAEDDTDVAPIVDTAAPHRIDRTYFTPLTLPAPQTRRHLDATHLPIDPQTHSTMQLWSAVHAMAQFNSDANHRFADYARVWVDGEPDALETPDPANDTVSFTDPWTMETFRARHFGTGPGEPGADVGASPVVHVSTGAAANEAGIAARMLLHAADINHQRLHGPVLGWRDFDGTLREYLGVIRAMRILSRCERTGWTDAACHAP